MTQIAVGFKQSTTGREQKTDGLWTHRGSLVVANLTVTNTVTLPTVLATNLSLEARLQQLEERLQKLERPQPEVHS